MKKGVIFIALISVAICGSLYYGFGKNYKMKKEIKLQSSAPSINNIVKSISIYQNGQKNELDVNEVGAVNKSINDAVQKIVGEVNRYIDPDFINNYKKNGVVIEISYSKPQLFDYTIANNKKYSEQYLHLSVILNYENLGDNNVLILSDNRVFASSEDSKVLETALKSF